MKLFMVSLLLCLLGVLPPAETEAGRVNTFIYHRFDESRYPSTNISAEIFTAQLTYLKEQNYQVLSLGEVARRLQLGEELPEKGAALCVDEAFISFAEVATPLLSEYGFPITQFVNTDAVGSRGYLDWDQLRKLQA